MLSNYFRDLKRSLRTCICNSHRSQPWNFHCIERNSRESSGRYRNCSHTLSCMKRPYYRIRIPYCTSCTDSLNYTSHNSLNKQHIRTLNNLRNNLNYRIRISQLSEHSRSMSCKSSHMQCKQNYLNNTHLHTPRISRFHCMSCTQFRRLSNFRFYTLTLKNIHTQNLIGYQCTCMFRSSNIHTVSNNCCTISLNCRTSKYLKDNWACRCNRMTSLVTRMHHQICRGITSL